jgi:citrate lyase beta subunit
VGLAKQEMDLRIATPTPRRSLLFVPGVDQRKLERAASSEADALILDLEDSVPPAEKERARERVVGRLAEGSARAELVVRVNGVDTCWFEKDVLATAAAGARVIMLPKSDLASLDRARIQLAATELELLLESGSIRLFGLVETAIGVLELPLLANEPARLDALCFGNADFACDMGLAEADLQNAAVHHARCTLALAAAAFSVTAIDGVCLALRDDEAFEAEARTGASLGFTGKLCIHPDQVGIANRIFTPSPEEISRATRVIEAAAVAEREGEGVVCVDDRMVDAPVVEASRLVLERARRSGVHANPEDRRR